MYKVVLTMTITEVDNKGNEKSFADTVQTYHNCEKKDVHAIEKAIVNALVALGD